MRHAPPVRLIVTEPTSWRAMQALLCGAAIGAPALWGALRVGASVQTAWLVAGLLCAVIGMGTWLRSFRADRVLVWDGCGAWRLDDRLGAVRLMIDVGGWMLLRFVPTGRRWPIWLALSDSSRAGGAAELHALHALRVALHATRAASALPVGIEADRAV